MSKELQVSKTIDYDFFQEVLEDIAHTKKRVTQLEGEVANLRSLLDDLLKTRVKAARPVTYDPINSIIGLQSKRVDEPDFFSRSITRR